MTVYLQDPDVTLLHGDVMEQLGTLPDESVHCVVTSPPYWGLRDYGTGSWAGGNPDCDHKAPGGGVKRGLDKQGPNGTSPKYAISEKVFFDSCGKCGAQRTDHQLGLEPTPDAYVARMVEVFREVRRVLRRDGTCWLNIGDSYAATSKGDTRNAEELAAKSGLKRNVAEHKRRETIERNKQYRADGRVSLDIGGLKPKDLVGIPWRLAFALQADGWYLRADIIWAKPNPMPESVTDRPTKSHEYLFLLTRSPRYFFDQEAVREKHTGANVVDGQWTGTPAVNRPEWEANTQGWNKADGKGGGMRTTHRDYNPAGRNVRSVWEIATQPYPEAHFATFPEELARRCILAGSSERGRCPVCGAPWVRETERVDQGYDGSRYGERAVEATGGAKSGGTARSTLGSSNGRLTGKTETLGWRPSCGHYENAEGHLRPEPFLQHAGREIVPCVVLDPFVGSGTVPHVARKHGRHSIGVDLNAEYLGLCARRLQQLRLDFTEATA